MKILTNKLLSVLLVVFSTNLWAAKIYDPKKDPMYKTAQAEAKKIIDSYVLSCGQKSYAESAISWIEFSKPPKQIYLAFTNQYSNAEMLNGFEWGGRFVAKIDAASRRTIPDNGNVKLTTWIDAREIEFDLIKFKGVWQLNKDYGVRAWLGGSIELVPVSFTCEDAAYYLK